MTRRNFSAGVMAGLLLSLLLCSHPLRAQSGSGSGGERTRARINLIGQRAHTDFEQRSDRTKFSTEVENLAQGTQVEIFLDRGGNVISLGTAVADGRGEADLNLDSRNGQTVPVIQAGDRVFVRINGQEVSSGVFPEFTSGQDNDFRNGNNRNNKTGGNNNSGPGNNNSGNTGGNNNSGSGSSGGDDRTRVRINLTGQRAHTDFEQRSDRTKFSTEVENLAQGTQVEIFLDRGGNITSLGTATADGRGEADLNLDSRNGQNVPVLQEGDRIFVQINGQEVSSGVIPAFIAGRTNDFRNGNNNNNQGNNNNNNNNQAVIQLAGGGLQSGNAKFEPQGARRELSVEGEDFAPGAQAESFLVRGGERTSLGTLTVGADGRFDLNLDTNDGDVVPEIQAGDVIEVEENGAVVISGTFDAASLASSQAFALSLADSQSLSAFAESAQALEAGELSDLRDELATFAFLNSAGTVDPFTASGAAIENPEPGSLLLWAALALVLGGCAWRRWRRRR